MRRTTVNSCIKTPSALTICMALAVGEAVAQPSPRVQPASVAIIGTPEAVLRSVGLDTTHIERARLPLDVVRYVYDGPGEESSLAQSIAHQAQTVSEFVRAWRRVAAEDAAATLNGSDQTARDRLENLLEAAGFQLRRRNGHHVVELGAGEDAARRKAVLAEIGFDVGRLGERLNAGESVAFDVSSFDVPLPLSSDVWLNEIYQGEALETLGWRILGDRRGALLYFGLMGTYPSTRAFLTSNSGVLRQIYDDHADAAALYARALDVDQNRVRVPGGAHAEPLWNALAGSRADAPADFLVAVLGRDERVLAFFYDAIAQLDEPRQRFALGLWLEQGQQLPRLRRLYALLREAPPLSPGHPFTRHFPDPTNVLSAVQVHASGEPVGPAWRGLWENVFGNDSLPANPEQEARSVQRTDLVDAAWLAERLFADTGGVRDRLETFLFAQRAFSDVDERSLPDVLVALRGFRSYPSLLLTLERLGIRQPGVYARAVQHAAQLERMPDPERWASGLSQFQGALGIIERVRHTNLLGVSDADELVLGLATLRVDLDSGYAGRLGAWLVDHLLPALRRAGCTSETAEGVLADALAGGPSAFFGESLPVIDWEGWPYRVDVRGAALSNIHAARSAAGNTLDEVMELHSLSTRLLAGQVSVEAAESHARALADLAGRLAERSGSADVTVSATLARARLELERMVAIGEVVPTSQLGAQLENVADTLLGNVLRSFVYAPQIGDARDVVLDGIDVADRHDFGFDPPPGETRRAGWMLPEVRMTPERPWYVLGSLLSLDLATADLRLAQVPTTVPPTRAVLKQADRDVVIKAASLFSSLARTQAEVDRIAIALRRGRNRVERLRHSQTEMEPIAEAARLSEWRRAQLAWLLANEPESLNGWFTLRELHWLGADDDADSVSKTSPWGAASFPSNGCLCLSVPAREAWEHWMGRPGSGLAPTVFPDLSLWVAEGLAARQLPVELAGDLLQVAVRHFIDRVRPQHPDDWDTVLRYPARLTMADFDEYVSSLTGGGPLKPGERIPGTQ